jgi:transposase
MRKRLLTDEQWKHIEPLLPEPRRRTRRGRPLKEFAVSPSVCWKRLAAWEEQDVWLRRWRAFRAKLDLPEKLDWSETFLDGNFASARKGATTLAQPGAGRTRSGWWWSKARVFLGEAK